MCRLIYESSNPVENISLLSSILHFGKISISHRVFSQITLTAIWPNQMLNSSVFLNFNNEIKRSKLFANGILKVSVFA